MLLFCCSVCVCWCCLPQLANSDDGQECMFQCSMMSVMFARIWSQSSYSMRAICSTQATVMEHSSRFTFSLSHTRHTHALNMVDRRSRARGIRPLWTLWIVHPAIRYTQSSMLETNALEKLFEWNGMVITIIILLRLFIVVFFFFVGQAWTYYTYCVLRNIHWKQHSRAALLLLSKV